MHESRPESPLTFETMLRDPLVHAVMRSDGVTVVELLDVLAIARSAVAHREQQAVQRALSAGAAVARRQGAP